MSENIFKVFGEQTKETLLEIIAKCMDDYLYVYDLQNNTMELSESAVDRFMISGNVINDVTNILLQVVYEEDRKMLQEHLTAICEGKEKVHNLHHRWLDKEGRPVWINCRGIVIDDSQGKPQYLVGCLNETGNQRRADNVTGLLGGLEFNAYMRSQKKHLSKGFLMHIGIDDFGAINSSRGAAYGNHILKSVADCMKECLSDKQRIYHLVADQYVIVDLEHSSKDYAAELKKKIDDRLYKFIVSENYEAVFSISVGVVDAVTFCEGYEECRKKFAFVLKKAKKMGKNGFYIFDDNDYESFLRTGKIVAALRNSVVNGFNGFEVYYQPIVDCSSERVIGAEALMRFSMTSEEDTETVSPVDFIPLLEETGLIIPAGRFVLNEAAAMCHEMRQYIPGFKVNVNISYIQMMKSDIWKDILSSIEQYNLPPESLCAELTESGYTDMTPYFYTLRKKFEEKKIQFILDDFGTGFSNLHCIVNMNPNYVKLDNHFTAKAMSQTRDFELLKKIVELVHSIDIKICIEGVEKEEWYQKLKEIHADYLQGYLFGRPCDKNQFLNQFICKGIN